MQHTFALLALPLLASALPTINLFPRAGAPSKTPLPSNCPLTNTQPPSGVNSTSFAPTASFDSANFLYSYSLSPGSTQPDGTNDTEAVQGCLETCYGYGDAGQCKSAWTAHGAWVESYGSKVWEEFVCRIYAAELTEADLGPAAEGDEDAQAKAINVGCARDS